MADTIDSGAAAGFLYGFPLVYDLSEVERLTRHGIGSTPPTPFNEFSHARSLASPAETFVSINNDTLYSIAQLDLSVGPIRLVIPESDRYLVLQFVDAWTNNFAYLGERATGRKRQEYLIVPPEWAGDDLGLQVVHAPTRVASIVGRWACDGESDLPAVHALQDQLRLVPLNPAAAGEGLPEVSPQGSPELDWWERYRVWSRAFPPAARDLPFQASLAALGVAGDTPVGALNTDQQATLEAGYHAGTESLDRLLHDGNGQTVNGWAMTLHLFDYNLDFFEIGALDDPAWKITDPMQRYAQRAAAAKGGLWGNHGYEAAYIMTYVDDHGDPLTGDRSYELRLSPTPPVDAFWSVTMYDTPDFYLVDNPIHRYSIGDRTPGLVKDDDGSITIHLSHDAPSGDEARANWLPAPAGAFRPILRMYNPQRPVLDGEWTPPAITRLV